MDWWRNGRSPSAFVTTRFRVRCRDSGRDLTGAARRPHERRRPQRGLRGPWERRAAFRQPDVRPVGFEAEKVRLHERIQDQSAHRALDPAEALYLFHPQLHTWHLEVLGAKAFQHPLIQECTHASARCSGGRGIRPVTQFAFGVQPVVNIVSRRTRPPVHGVNRVVTCAYITQSGPARLSGSDGDAPCRATLGPLDS